MSGATIIRADARSLPLADASVDLVVTSPPYFALRSYSDGGEHYAGQVGSEATPAEFIEALLECTREMVRVLKPTGSIWVNLGDKYAGAPSGPRTPMGDGYFRDYEAREFRERRRVRHSIAAKSLMLLPERYRIACVDQLGLIARAVVIWSKPNGLPESVTDRVRRSHEDWVHLTKQPRYFSAVDEIREDYRAKPDPRGSSWSDRQAAGEASRRGEQRDNIAGVRLASNPLGKLPGSVWEIATQPLTVPAELGIDHFAAFPMEWPRRIILGWSPAAGLVLDPFGGTGTTALLAKALGRHGISVDMSADYCRLAEWRTTDPGELAKAMQVEKPPAVLDEQLSLLDLAMEGAH